MLKVNYKLNIGNWSVNSEDDPRTEFMTLEADHSIGSSADFCRIAIYAPPAPKKGLLEQLAGEATQLAGGALGLGGGPKEKAFSVQVRGNAIKYGDQITVELTAGNLSAKVMTAEVQSIESSFGQTRIEGVTGQRKLANTRVNQVYENKTLSQIVKDFAGQAAVSTGAIDTGSSYSYFVAHESRNLLSQIRQLAAREGMDLYFDQDNKLTLKKFNKSSADHTFYAGIDILDLQVVNQQPPSDHILIYGESAASNQGAKTWHWLAKDLKPFRSELGKGNKRLAVSDGVIRTKDGAELLSKSKLGAIKDQATGGRLKLLGNPTVKLGDAIEIKESPKPELNGLFKVVSVRHRYSKQQGFITIVDFTGQGGSKSAEGLLGQALGQLGGAVGL